MYGIRAELVLTILNIYNAGFTLLGDNCQAIYDYQSEKMSSKKFYSILEALFSEATKIKYKEQKRLTPILDQKAVLLRSAIESKDEKMMDYLIQQILTNITTRKVEDIEEGIILTRRNGKAYEISRSINIKHNLLNTEKYINYPSWIGYLFSDHEKSIIGKKDFENKVFHKLQITEQEKIDSYWNYCKEIEKGKEEILDIEEMHKNIIISDNMEMKNSDENEKVVISTIHKAKGKEFENAYLDKEIEERRDNEIITDYAKLLYVAITRAKKNCYKISFENNNQKRNYRRILQEERYIEYTYKKKKKGQTDKSIRKIEIGLEKDIDTTSFINDKIVGNATENIEYLKNYVQKGDYVDLVLEEDQYYIYHNKRKIGKMNIEDLYEKAQKELNKVKEMSFKPKIYSQVKIKRTTTMAMFQEFIPSEIQNIYAKTGMWIGIELEGFGELIWNKD